MSSNKQANNPFGFDPSTMFAQLDPNKVMGDFSKALSEFKIPGIDGTALAESQRKNFEALAQANKIALEGMQSVFQRQGEIMNTAMQEMQAVLKEVSFDGEPQDKIANQTDLVKSALEKALENMKELAAMAGQTNSEAFDKIHQRFTASLDEVKAEVLKTK